MSTAAWKKLVSRALDGDKEAVRNMINANGGGTEALFSLSNPKTGDNVLHALCRDDGGRLDMFRFIVDLCGDAACGLGNFDGKTPLHEAAQCKSPSAVSFLLGRGVEVDALKRADWTPLMLACTKAGNDAVVAALLKAGADPALQNKDGWTPFHLAARAAEGGTVVLQILLQSDSSLWNTRKVDVGNLCGSTLWLGFRFSLKYVWLSSQKSQWPHSPSHGRPERKERSCRIHAEDIGRRRDGSCKGLMRIHCHHRRR